ADAVSGTGAALEPLMFASNDAVAIAASATVPVPVIGDPPVEIPVPALMLVTVPAPAGLSHTTSEPVPVVFRNCPLTPGAKAAHPPTPRVSTNPRVVPSTESSSVVSVVGTGAAAAPEVLASSLSSG